MYIRFVFFFFHHLINHKTKARFSFSETNPICRFLNRFLFIITKKVIFCQSLKEEEKQTNKVKTNFLSFDIDYFVMGDESKK